MSQDRSIVMIVLLECDTDTRHVSCNERIANCGPRYVSSGTGRPVALRDTDIEVPFPPADEEDSATGWPAPFPALIRIIHLYGRVTDLLNSIHEVNHLTPDTLQRLAALESELTGMLNLLL